MVKGLGTKVANPVGLLFQYGLLRRIRTGDAMTRQMMIFVTVLFSVFSFLGCGENDRPPEIAQLVSQDDLFQGSDEAAFMAVVYGESELGEESITAIACLDLYSDGTAYGYALYPPDIDSSEMTWVLDESQGILTVQYQNRSDHSDQYLVSPGVLTQDPEGDGIYSGCEYSYIGTYSDALDEADNLLAEVYSGGIPDTSLHYHDAQALHRAVSSMGYSPIVNIQETNSLENIFFGYKGCWFLSESDLEVNTRRIVYSFAAAGYLTENTSWRANDAIVMFEDYVFILSTQDCRELVSTFEIPMIVAANSNFSDFYSACHPQEEDDVPERVAEVIGFLRTSHGGGSYDWEYVFDLPAVQLSELGYYLMAIKLDIPLNGFGNRSWQAILAEWEIVSGSELFSAEEAYSLLTERRSGNDVLRTDVLGAWDAWSEMSKYPESSNQVLNGAFSYIIENCRSSNIGYSVN